MIRISLCKGVLTDRGLENDKQDCNCRCETVKISSFAMLFQVTDSSRIRNAKYKMCLFLKLH